MSGRKATIAIASGDPAGIGPEISLKTALDPAVRMACNPILVGDAGVIERHAEACGIKPTFALSQRAADADWSDGRIKRSCLRATGLGRPALRRYERSERSRLARLRQARDQGRAGRRSGCGGGCAAERDLDCARRHRVRRLSVVRRARDRHRPRRRLSDALLRRHEDRPRHAAPQRPRRARR